MVSSTTANLGSSRRFLALLLCLLALPVFAGPTWEEIEQRLCAGLEAMRERIDVQDADLTINEGRQLFYHVLVTHPEYCHVAAQYTYSYKGNSLRSFKPVYTFDSLATVQKKQKKVKAAFAQALSQVNDTMSDLEKALVLHDYLVTNCDYEDTGKKSHIRDSYGILVLGRGVCAGYAVVYAQLLRQAGVPAEFVNSNQMAHSWNLVQIDGQWYHADSTWDDLLTNSEKKDTVKHDNFLLSSAALRKNGSMSHPQWDEPLHECTDTRFDHYFWRTAKEAPLPVRDGFAYQFLDGTRDLYRYNLATGHGTLSMRAAPCTWKEGSNLCYYTMVSYRDLLLYNDATKLYVYQPETDENIELSLKAGTTALPCHTPYVAGGEELYAVRRSTPKANGKFVELPWKRVTGIEFSQTSRSYQATGTSQTKSFRLTATVLPQKATCPYLNWMTSNEAVATVDANGKVRVQLQTPGTAVISAVAWDGGVSASCEITVEPPEGMVQLVVSASEGGSAEGGGWCRLGETATLTATEEKGYKFLRWEKDGSTVSKEMVYTFPVEEGGAYRAIFRKRNYTIVVQASKSSWGTVSGGGSYPYQDKAKLQATPKAGYRFVHWERDGKVVSQSNPYSFTVKKKGTYTAVFKKK